ncbi:MAG: hypothetical protein GY758_30810 [Fuerstiella sp.]|nr:hypothetical protein [Fuerstiella sp.]MCP4505940.1 hypothetical protein [Fuerstiella sp.]MCP4857920.1 hypothetical protein [Fuerstiella sp.]MDG2130390.1 hypothetical protein [Fuerstiella sp.]
MRRVLTTAVALIIAFSVTAGSEAEAGKRRASKSRGARTAVQSRSNGGFFARIMEVERRKNAWLRANFTRG